jgi:hypothetical protein
MGEGLLGLALRAEQGPVPLLNPWFLWRSDSVLTKGCWPGPLSCLPGVLPWILEGEPSASRREANGEQFGRPDPVPMKYELDRKSVAVTGVLTTSPSENGPPHQVPIK